MNFWELKGNLIMLTLNQQRAYQFICEFIQQNGYSPTLPEIALGMGIRSKGHAHRYVQALINEGLIQVLPGRHRGIQLLDTSHDHSNDLCIPWVGKIAAGKPIEAISDNQSINLNALLGGNNRYILKVYGNSMIDDGIYDGDLVVCEYKQNANNGQIVVAMIDNEFATLKRFKHNHNGTITLIPANSDLLPMIYDETRVQVQGIFVGLVRLG